MRIIVDPIAQLRQMIQKPNVGEHPALLESVRQRLRSIHPPVQDQVSQYKGCRPRNADHTVHEHLSAALDGVIDVFGGLFEIDGDVPCWSVMAGDSHVLDLHVLVVVFVCVDL